MAQNSPQRARTSPKTRQDSSEFSKEPLVAEFERGDRHTAILQEEAVKNHSEQNYFQETLVMMNSSSIHANK